MWPQWLRSRRKVHSSPQSPKTPSHFSFSTFKDIQTLCKEEYGHEPTSPYHHSKKPSVFHRSRSSSITFPNWAHRNASLSSQTSINIPNGDRQIILYFTSLRVVRKTFEDCSIVRSILRGYRVPIDERDLSMDCKFIIELHETMKMFNKKVTLPTVFIGGKYFGGVEEIKQLHESGELKNLIGGFPFVGSITCDLCGGLQFIVCEECNGSHKIYSEKLGFRSCTACNMNGLVRCPSCCPVLVRCSSSYS